MHAMHALSMLSTRLPDVVKAMFAAMLSAASILGESFSLLVLVSGKK